VPGAVTEQGIDKRDITGDDTHDPAAAADDQWSLKQIQVAGAWTKIRDQLGLAEGAEASGIIIAHPDTGYRHHPETWSEIGGKRPIDFEHGKNYYEGGADAFDPLLGDRLLDNPGHGTASGSVIVSPPGCQLPNAPGCVNGIARGAQLVPLRVHRTVSQFNTRNLSQAIQDVADGNVAGNPHLASIAMGGPPTLTMWSAVKAAEKNGVVIVAASGNYVRIVVWPARFRSTIAVAAGNVHCNPWKHSSRGSAIDIMAPGESVWRATLNENHEHVNAMGKGTTFATGNVAGSAALWLSAHRNDPALRALMEQGQLTKAFRAALRSSAWRPSGSPSANPPGTQCDTSTWDEDYGPGILNVAALVDVPLGGTQSREVVSAEDETIPLFASLYSEGTDPEKIRSDYLSLFASSQRGSMQTLSSFETEILYHYTVNEEVQRSIDALLAGQRGGAPADSVRRALARQDLSGRLRQAIGQ
jgi:subtilisin family serine protease